MIARINWSVILRHTFPPLVRLTGCGAQLIDDITDYIVGDWMEDDWVKLDWISVRWTSRHCRLDIHR